jgi:signal transduction histidine kinase
MPPLVAGLGLLFLIQIPLSWRLARRLRRSSEDRAGYLQRAIDSAEIERWRIAGDLHDGPVQTLTAVNLALGGAAIRIRDKERNPASEEELMEMLDNAAGAARTTIRELRTMIVEIAPPDLDQGGLEAALGRLAGSARAEGMEVTVEVGESVGDGLSLEETALIYRVAQESVRNVIKHSRAKQVDIRLAKEGKTLVLTIKDNGAGFSAEQEKQRNKAGHVGLTLLKDRAAAAGASLVVSSNVGVGTTVRLELARA